MAKDYTSRNLQKKRFNHEELAYTDFSGSDLRGADFTGADLTGADFTRVKTGIPSGAAALIFIIALIISLFSGYVAMLAGHTMQVMLGSPDAHIRNAGIATVVLVLLFIILALWKGGGNAIRNLAFPAVFIAILVGLIYHLTGAGTGRGMLYLVVAVVLVVVMFIVGTIARAAAGTLSSAIIFSIVALGGGIFGTSVGGGFGTVIMALSCAVISKRALSGAKGFESLKRIASRITARFGTSFRNANLSDVDFSGSRIHNADFTNADVSSVEWGDAKRSNCIISEKLQ